MEKLPLAKLRTWTASARTRPMRSSSTLPSGRSLSESCLGCGTCTFVCPTCQCYDIRDFNTGARRGALPLLGQLHVLRFHQDVRAVNPRLTQLERFRQRFMHKLVYFPANNDGLFGCVGCGRCLEPSCPIQMNIVKVDQDAAEEVRQHG